MKRLISCCTLAIFAVTLLVGCQKDLNSANLDRDPDALKSDNATIWTKNVQLSGANEVPSVNTITTGVAILRLTKGGVLHSKVNVEDIEEGDALRFSHIHTAPAGQNGPVYLFLVHTANGFGMNHEQQLTEQQVQHILNASIYVNVHSNHYPGGIIRGQIR